MVYVKQLVDEIYEKFKIPFQLEIDNDDEYTSQYFNESESKIEKIFYFEKAKCCIRIYATFSYTIDLLIYCVETKLKEVFTLKRDILSDLLVGNHVNKDLITQIWPSITSDFNVMCIHIEKYINEVISLIKAGYLHSGIEVIENDSNIIMIGNFEDVSEHAKSIKESIEEQFTTKFYISYCSINKFEEIKNAYEDSLYKVELAKKYNLSETIFDEKKLIFELIVDSIPEKNKKNIYENFNEGFSELDNEMIRTIEVYFKCGLNLSDAAKELYIHRNTLIYRLDKIQKCTSYDIREFNNAVLFKIVFFVWKQKKQITN